MSSLRVVFSVIVMSASFLQDALPAKQMFPDTTQKQMGAQAEGVLTITTPLLIPSEHSLWLRLNICPPVCTLTFK